jgi:putative ABC transport system permease protein
MIRFLIKGLIRDKSRSRLPILVVTLGVMLTIFLHAYIVGFMGDTIEMNARFNNGHVKLMTRAYAQNMDQSPNDLALLGVDSLLVKLNREYPGMSWSPRIRFGGLVDVPDENGETRAQGTALGMGIDLFTPGTPEPSRLHLEKSLVRGHMPQQSGEVLLSESFSQKLKVHPGDRVTLIGSTMEGGMAMVNFIVAGTLSFGVEIMDRGTLLADLTDVQTALQMPDGAGEINGYFHKGFYDDERAASLAATFNDALKEDPDEFAPLLMPLSQQGGMATYVTMVDTWSGYISLVFILAMSLVLWNAGLLGGLRRYGEVGVRLAMGEEKTHVYGTMIVESVCIGLVGSVIGTALGLAFSWILQEYGINISGLMKGASVMFPDKIRARITPQDFYLGFIPGLFSTVLGTVLSGVGIFKRQTARLFKELET